MPSPDWSILTPVLAVLGTVIVGVLGVWLNNKTRVDSRVVADQKRTDERITKLEADLAAERSDRRVLEDYVYDLRRELDQAGVVPPDWPKELDRARP